MVLHISRSFDMELYKDLGRFFIRESLRRFLREMWLHPKRALIPFGAPGSEIQPESPWQVLAGFFVLRMRVPEPFPKEGLGWKCPHVRPRKSGEVPQSVDLGRSVRTSCPGGGFLPPTPLRWTPVLHILEREFRNGGAEPLFRPSSPKPRTPRGGVSQLGLLGLIRFGLHGSGVPSRGFSSS